MELGKFIAFEGGEGAGKSTQARAARRGAGSTRYRLRAHARAREARRAPKRSASCCFTRRARAGVAEAEALLFAAARADHVARLIRPALAEGKWVICDRFVDSSRAYQGAAGALGDEMVRALHDIGSGGLLPDLTIVMTALPERVADRLAARDGGAVPMRSADAQRIITRGWRTLFAPLRKPSPPASRWSMARAVSKPCTGESWRWWLRCADRA